VSTSTAGRFVGQSVKRREDPRLLTGHGCYVDDVMLPGMLHCAFVRSDVARGRITRVDVEAARELDGVVAVLTAGDLNPHAGTMQPTLVMAMPGAPLRPLADGDVRFVGEPIVLVVARSRYLAEDATELVEVDIDGEPAVVDVERALDPGVRSSARTSPRRWRSRSRPSSTRCSRATGSSGGPSVSTGIRRYPWRRAASSSSTNPAAGRSTRG
jgi:CO/xanthine dehydrogenase Mo-binding subunit